MTFISFLRRSPRRSATKAVAIGASAAMLAVLAACGGSADDGADENAVQLGVFPIFMALPAWTALEEGIFEKNGLEVELNTMLSGPPMISGLGSTSLDFILTGSASILPAVAKGLPARLVSPMAPLASEQLLMSKDLYGSCAAASQPLPAPYTCLKGKRIGVSALGSGFHLMALGMLKEAGLSEGDVTFVPSIGNEAVGKAFKTDQVDAAITEDLGAAYATEVVDSGEVVTRLRDQEAFAAWDAHSVWALDENLKASPETAEKLVKSLREAIAWLDDAANKDAAEAIFKKYAPTISDETIEVLIDQIAGFFATDTSSCKNYQNVIDWQRGAGLLTADQADSLDCAKLAFETAALK